MYKQINEMPDYEITKTGIGSYYSEAIDDNQQLVFMEFGFPKFNNIIDVLKTRYKYLSKLYVKVSNITYKLYDYYTKKEIKFDNIKDTIEYLNSVEPLTVVVTKNMIHNKVGKIKNTGKTSLIKGYGITSSLHRNVYTWYNYTEETILSSMYNKITTLRAWKITDGVNEKIFIGMHNLCKYLDIKTNKNLSKLTLADLQSFITTPNTVIKRLNKTIEDN